MRLRGGDRGPDDLWHTLRELLGRPAGDGEDPSVVSSVLDSMGALPPTTRTLLVTNVAVYLSARLGLLGSDPAERFGFRARDLLLGSVNEAHRLITGTFLHLNHAHILSNMMVLSSVGSKLESRLGSKRMAALVAFLIPVIGATQLTLTILLNAAAAMCGLRDVENEPSSVSAARHNSTLTRVVRHQVSVNTISIGFSGVLFALNAFATRMLSGKSTISIRLDEIPYQVRLMVMQYFSDFVDRRWGTPVLAVPAEWAPFVQVIVAQFSDPARVSFIGHLSGAVGAAVLQCGQGIKWWQAVYPARRLFRSRKHGLQLGQALVTLLWLLPVHIAVWWLGRRAVVLAANRMRSGARAGAGSGNASDPATDWAGAVRSLWRKAGGAGAGDGWRRGGSSSAQRGRKWGSGAWGGGEGRGFVGQWVSVVGLQEQAELNGLQGRLVGIDKATGRFLVQLQGVEHNVALRPRNIARMVQHGSHERIDPRVWTVSQVGTYMRECGYEAAARILERRAVTGSSLKGLREDDLEAFGIHPTHRPALLKIIRDL
jgi:membrane associated rhomboid family serine protease